VSRASTGLCGGQRVTAVPTATRVETPLDAFRSGPKSREGITSPSHPTLSAAWEVGQGDKRR